MTDPATAQATTVATRATLCSAAAIWNALLSCKIDFYPRVAEGGAISTLATVPMVQEMERTSARWPTLDDNDALKSAIDLAKDSLAEVKGQTEYQDQKATRLLTVTTFLSALSGVLFSRFEDAYPVDAITSQPFVEALLLGCSYGAFAAFVILSLSGALVTFHATRTRFKYPPYQTTEDQENDPESLLFYGGLIRSRPRAWIKGWVTAGDPMAIQETSQSFATTCGSAIFGTWSARLISLPRRPPTSCVTSSRRKVCWRFRCGSYFSGCFCSRLLTLFVPSTKPPVQPTKVTLISGPAHSAPPPSAQPAGPAENIRPPEMNAPSKGTETQHP